MTAKTQYFVRNSCFNSLQTGKPIQSCPQIFRRAQLRDIEFQFPSNGKAYPKPALLGGVRDTRTRTFQFPSNGKAYPKLTIETQATEEQVFVWVSIPFKRESLSKVAERNRGCQLIHWFQFPSNGKAYPKRLSVKSGKGKFTILFQFPSNGKAYPKII